MIDSDFISTYGNNLIIAVVGVGVALLLMAIILWLIRRRGGSSPFIRGGKNRQPRLQVLDATAVDARRRLVLVRRDNVEHLVMIGGPTDIVIENGIGAIPIMRDVRDPQDDLLPSPPADKAISSNRQRALTSAKEEDVRPVSAVAPQAPVAATHPPAQPKPAPAPAPAAPQRPVIAAQPKQTPPVAPTVVATPAPPASRPVAPPVTEQAPEVAAVPKPVAREPIAPSVASSVVPPSVIPVVTAASLQPEPVAKPSAPEPATQERVQPQPVVITPPTVSAPEPVVDQNTAVDFLDAARERVLPTFRSAAPMTASANVAKPEPLAPGENGAVFGDQLTSDFESFLEAEIAKNNAADTPNVSVEPRKHPEFTEPVAPPAPNANTDQDVQKEMARIFGEMAVTRDK